MNLNVNGVEWKFLFVNPEDYNLINNQGKYTLGMTDNNIHCVFISNNIYGKLLYNVLCHELCHVYIFSYNIYMDVEDEEHLAQFIADYGKWIISDTNELLHYIIHTP